MDGRAGGLAGGGSQAFDETDVPRILRWRQKQVRAAAATAARRVLGYRGFNGFNQRPEPVGLSGTVLAQWVSTCAIVGRHTAREAALSPACEQSGASTGSSRAARSHLRQRASSPEHDGTPLRLLLRLCCRLGKRGRLRGARVCRQAAVRLLQAPAAAHPSIARPLMAKFDRLLRSCAHSLAGVWGGREGRTISCAWRKLRSTSRPA